MKWVEVVDRAAVAVAVLAVVLDVGRAGWTALLLLAPAAPVCVPVVAIGRRT